MSLFPNCCLPCIFKVKEILTCLNEQAKIRFPSMFIRRDGLMPTKDPLSEIQQTLSTKMLPIR